MDLSENPYYMTEQPGYEYSEPETITYPSGITGTERHAMVLLPADYDEDEEYPVLYLLHGMGGSHRTWRNKDAHIIIQNLHYFYGVPEMITVFANSCVNEEESTEDLSLEDTVKAFDGTADDLVGSLMPYIEAQLFRENGTGRHRSGRKFHRERRSARYAGFHASGSVGLCGEPFLRSPVAGQSGLRMRSCPL